MTPRPDDDSVTDAQLDDGAASARPRRRRRRLWRARPRIEKVWNALRGLWVALQRDRSVAWKLPVFLVVLGSAVYLRNWVDVAVLIVATSVLFAAELFNTAIEELCDFVEPRFDERIGAIKDIAAAAVMLCHVAWGAVIAIELYRLFSSGVVSASPT